jgi:hypothetical protein
LRDARVEARAAVRHQLEHGAVELHDLVVGRANDEPRAVTAAVPAPAAGVDAPGPGHAQVRVDREAALEADQQVLAVRVDGPHAAARKLLGPAILPEARVQRLDRLDLMPDQGGADAVRGSPDRVAFGHATKAIQSIVRRPLPRT